MEYKQSKCEKRVQCPRCAEQGRDTQEDNLLVFDDGHTHCFACGYHTTSDGQSFTGKVSKPTTTSYSIPYETIELEGIPSRGIESYVTEAYGLRTLIKTNKKGIPILKGGYLQSNGVMCIPYRNVLLPGAPVTAVKYRRWGLPKDDPKAIWVEGTQSNTVFGANVLPEKCENIILTESETDAMAWYSYLVEVELDDEWGVIALPGIEYFTRTLPNILEWLLKFNNIYVAVDNDVASQNHLATIKELLPPIQSKIIELPWEKDASELWASGDKGTLHACLNNAIVLTNKMMALFDDVADNALAWLNDDEQRLGWSTGYEGLDYLIGKYTPGKVICIAAIPKDGKTTLVMNLTYNAVLNGHKVLFIPLEMKPDEVLLCLASIHMGINLYETPKDYLVWKKQRKLYVFSQGKYNLLNITPLWNLRCFVSVCMQE